MIRIVEVGPRDGLQNEQRQISTADKVEFIDLLSQTGVDEIEVSSFVSSKWVPRLADAEEVFRRIKRNSSISYCALVPNIHGFKRALEAQPDRIAVFTAATDSFCQRNVGSDIEGTFERFKVVLEQARSNSIPVRGYVSVAFWCPYAGKVEADKVLPVVERLLKMGCEEISIGDTIGKARPTEVAELLEKLHGVCPNEKLAMHFHDTFGYASENIRESFKQGIEIFDGSVGGLGGCPYAGPGAPGNVATSTIVETLRSEGAQVNVDLVALGAARHHIQQILA